VLDPSREVALEKALAIKARLENAHDSKIRL
jgi:hypothetical protein